jgi:hypothetical protein
MLANEFISLCGLSASNNNTQHQQLVEYLLAYLPSDLIEETPEEVWSSLPYYAQASILKEQGLPERYPAPWQGSKGFKRLIKSLDKDDQNTFILLHFAADWTIEQLRNLQGKTLIPVDNHIEGDDVLFLCNHSVKVLSKLIENHYIGEVWIEVIAEMHHYDSSHYFPLLVSTWSWLHDNHPEVLKGIRVRDILSYYEKLRDLKLKLEPAVPLPIDETLKERVGATLQEYEIEFPSDSKRLINWGEQLNHCVGGYGQKVKAGNCSILSLNKDGVPVFTVEVVKDPHYRIEQFFGYGNSDAPEELRKALYRKLNKKTLKEQVSSILFYKLW